MDLLSHSLLEAANLYISQISGQLIARRLQMGTAESCTGGLVAALCTSRPGSSAWFTGAVVAYENRIKQRILGVQDHVLQTVGAVSGQCVEQMARGAQRALQVSATVAISGVAGPTGGTPEKPVGTVWIAWAVDTTLNAMQYQFDGDRDAVRAASAVAALAGLAKLLDALG
ncbi:CinA family protein [Megalodesulfovibrio paquesii]